MKKITVFKSKETRNGFFVGMAVAVVLTVVAAMIVLPKGMSLLKDNKNLVAFVEKNPNSIVLANNLLVNYEEDVEALMNLYANNKKVVHNNLKFMVKEQDKILNYLENREYYVVASNTMIPGLESEISDLETQVESLGGQLDHVTKITWNSVPDSINNPVEWVKSFDSPNVLVVQHKSDGSLPGTLLKLSENDSISTVIMGLQTKKNVRYIAGDHRVALMHPDRTGLYELPADSIFAKHDYWYAELN